MATVTYYGPRPELVPAFPMPMADFRDDGEGAMQVVRYGGRQMVRPVSVHCVARTPVSCPALFALGLAMIRRRPSPWFNVEFSRGEFAEIAHRIPGEDDSCPGDHPTEAVCSWCVHPDYTRTGYRGRVLAYLGWGRGQIEEFYASERKVLIVNDQVVYAPPGWKPSTA